MSDPHSVRAFRLCALFALVSLCATATAADDPGARAPVVVWTVKGDVHATSGSRDIALKAGLALQLPVSIRVGADGALEMHQGATVVSAAANSQLQIPKATSSDQTLDRIVQSEGNVYYNVAKRPAHKLRVETPLLVAVIKGTRFNVSAVDTMTTISLLEGSIEVHASDDSSVVDLSAGQMATRSRSQPAIRVIRMTTGEVIHGPTSEVAAAIAAGQRVDSGIQGQAHSRDEVTRPAALVAISPLTAEMPTPAVQTSNLATGVASGQGDDHGASISLTLNQLVTHANSSASASNVGGSAGAGSGVDTGTSGSNGGSLGVNTGASGSNGGGLGSATGASGAGGGGLGSATGASGAGGGSVGTGAGGGSVGTGTGASGAGGGNLGATTGTSSTPGGSLGGTTGSPASGASGTGSASASANGNGNGSGNGSGNGNVGTTFSPGNSGITVTPGSGTGTSSASNSGNSGSGNSNGQGPGSSNGQGAGNSNGQGSSNSSGQGSGSSTSSNGSSGSNGQGNSSSSNGQGAANLNAALQALLNKKKK